MMTAYALLYVNFPLSHSKVFWVILTEGLHFIRRFKLIILFIDYDDQNKFPLPVQTYKLVILIQVLTVDQQVRFPQVFEDY